MLFTVLEAIENLTLALCKHRKRKEQLNKTFWYLILKTVALVKFLKTENLTENVLIPCKLPHSLLEFWGIFCFKNLINVTVFNCLKNDEKGL